MNDNYCSHSTAFNSSVIIIKLESRIEKLNRNVNGTDDNDFSREKKTITFIRHLSDVYHQVVFLFSLTSPVADAAKVNELKRKMTKTKHKNISKQAQRNETKKYIYIYYTRNRKKKINNKSGKLKLKRKTVAKCTNKSVKTSTCYIEMVNINNVLSLYSFIKAGTNKHEPYTEKRPPTN